MSPGSHTKVLSCTSLLLVAALGFGGWALWGDGGASGLPHSGLRQETVEKAPRDPAGRQLFTLDAPELKKQGTGASTPGSWATATSYVKTGYGSITAYAASSGKRLWNLSLTGDVCSATEDVTPEGLTAVVVRDYLNEEPHNNSDCNRLLVFDIDSGRKIWETALPKNKARFSTPDVHIGKGIVGVTWFKGSVAYPITGGEALWSKGAAQCSYEMRLGGGRELIASGRGCVQKHSRRAIWKVDPRTGEPEWTYKVPKKYWTWQVLSTDPVVVAVGEGDSNDDHEDTLMTHVLTLDQHGRLRATIPLSEDHDLYYWDSRRHQHVVTRDTLYLPRNGVLRDEHAGAVVAFDLATGEVKKSYPAEGDRSLIPLRMSGERLLTLQIDDWSGSKTATKVFSIDPATGRRTLMLAAESADQEIRSLMVLDDPTVVFEHGRLYFGRSRVIGPRKGIRTIGSDRRTPGAPAERHLGVAFGTG